MIKKFTSTTVAALTILTMFSTGNVYADNNTNSNKETTEKKSVAVANVNNLNIRKGPSTLYDIIGEFDKNDDVNIVSIKDGWYKIELEDGKTAWTNGQYITLDGEVSVDKLNVRKGPAITYDIVETKKEDEKVKIVKADENGWYEIELKDGETGFICGKYVDTEAENKHDYSDLYNVVKESSNKKSSKIKSTAATTKKSSSLNTSRTITVSATAYAGDTITATGTTPRVGRTIAVDPSVIPYGTRVYIPSLGRTYIAEDCGGGIKGNKIDIFMSSESECNTWGVRSIEVQILK